MASNNNGRLVTVADGGGSESYTYDLMGRITQGSKVINGNTYNVGYGYNTAGQLNSLTYPSGRVVSQGYDSVGRMSQISSGATNYLSSPTYNAAGQPLGFSYGNGVNASFTYNDHLQIASLRYFKPGVSPDVLNLGYDYGTQNNGQIQAEHVYDTPGGAENQIFSQYYSYDAWGRLKAAHTGVVDATPYPQYTWSLQWDYDRFGNRRNQTLIGGGASITQPQLTISETTNRITDAGYAHDAAGNMTNDSLHTYAYDAENRTKTVDSTAASYSFVGALRVKKVVGATTTVYVFSGSKVIAEYVNGALSKEYVYAGSQLLATVQGSDGAVTYQHSDHLSVRTESDSAGNLTRGFGHFPFGESWYEGPATNKWKFTSYERDSESGVDYATFRYDSSRLGRFMSPDPLGGSVLDPQSLNRYSYVRNDPVNGVDPLGLTNFKLSAVHVDWNCSLNGTATPCSLVASAVSAGGAVWCPNNDCSVFQQTYTTASGGSFSLVAAANGFVWVNNLNGQELLPEGAAELGLPGVYDFAGGYPDSGSLGSLKLEPESDFCDSSGRNIYYKIIRGNGGRVLGDYYIHEIVYNDPHHAGAFVGDSERNGFKDWITLDLQIPQYTVVQMFRIATTPSGSGVPISIQRVLNGQTVTLSSQTIVRQNPTIRVAGTRGDNCE